MCFRWGASGALVPVRAGARASLCHRLPKDVGGNGLQSTVRQDYLAMFLRFIHREQAPLPRKPPPPPARRIDRLKKPTCRDLRLTKARLQPGGDLLLACGNILDFAESTWLLPSQPRLRT